MYNSYPQILAVSFNGPIPSVVVMSFQHAPSVLSGSREEDLNPHLAEKACLQRDQFHLPLNWEEDKRRGIPTPDLH